MDIGGGGKVQWLHPVSEKGDLNANICPAKTQQISRAIADSFARKYRLGCLKFGGDSACPRRALDGDI